MKRPLSCVNLNKAIIRVAGIGDPVRLSRAIANVIIGQILPEGVIKGGSSLMFRYGPEFTRYTRDIDAARSIGLNEYLDRLAHALAMGWNGFSGKVVAVPPPHPQGVPAAYVMVPYDVKLDYMGKPWQTVRVEVGHNEIGDADDYELFLPTDLGDAFEQLGFPRPRPLRVMRLAYQVAQKLHAVSEPGSERAHDLIDLQLMALRSSLDFGEIHEKCIRLFAYRKRQTWPPVITQGINWDTAYTNALRTIQDASELFPTVSEAVIWVNNLIAAIDSSSV